MVVALGPFIKGGQAGNLAGDGMGTDLVLGQVGNEMLGVERLTLAPVPPPLGQPGDPDVQIRVVVVASRVGVALGVFQKVQELFFGFS